ncbi:uncharacterized protein EV154DRAFT_226206 [Mucor mucedo]|uniref:uncharacterized protein n=1 Tax=Mucor mucedo TaxID=29922 RepID=UPI002220C90A|nr:uncharacterized protein EV154DRAFT_226206 [Mucor mucedo]KAI7891300.1 hypothetical protein EV154DRAFT_226206 [Mucor mucedo]
MGLSINSYSFFIAILGLYMAFYQSDYSFIVSLDFGNSFSGTCCAITPRLSSKQSRASEYPEFLHVNNWPEQYEFQRKTPSIIAYDRNLHLLHWGMTAFNLRKNGQLKDDQRIVEKFKFGLPTSIAQKGAFRPAGNTSINQLINMRAAIDFFREIMDHTVANLLNDEKENIRFVITVPEQWNDAQKSLMRFVAIEAGLISEDDFEQRLLIINESLAALLYCERNTNIDGKKYNDKKNEFMLKNDKYMICDAGGATVSIAVFEAAQHNNDNFRRCQLTAGIEYNCGSAFLDLKMKEALLNICFGADKEAWKDNNSKKEALELLITPLVEQFRLSKVLKS